jgi:Putative transposase DNA-binding domain
VERLRRLQQRLARQKEGSNCRRQTAQAIERLDAEAHESQAGFRCRACGLVEHADANAAKNILSLAAGTLPKARSSNVRSRRVWNRWARTTSDASARPRARSRYRRASVHAIPSSERERPPTWKVPAARSSRKASSTSTPRRVRIR